MKATPTQRRSLSKELCNWTSRGISRPRRIGMLSRSSGWIATLAILHITGAIRPATAETTSRGDAKSGPSVPALSGPSAVREAHPLGALRRTPQGSVGGPLLILDGGSGAASGTAAPRTLTSWAQALTMLKARSTDLRIAALEVAKAEAQSWDAVASLLPKISAGVEYTRQWLRHTSGAVGVDGRGALVMQNVTLPAADSISGKVAVTLPVLHAPAWHALETARLVEEVARLDRESLRRRLTLGLANAIVAVMAAERVGKLSQQGFAEARARRDLSAARLQNGLGTKLDLRRADQDVIAAQGALVGSEEALLRAREALGLALGVSEPVGVLASFGVEGLLSGVRTSCLMLANPRDRSDIVALRRQREVLERKATNLNLQFVPTVSLQSAISTSSPRVSSLPPALWSVQGIASWSIWDGGAREAASRSARADAAQADARRKALQNATVVEVEQARRSVSVAEHTLAMAKQDRDAARDIDELTKTTFVAGMATSLELVVAASDLRQAEIALALRRFELAQARVAALLVVASCPR